MGYVHIVTVGTSLLFEDPGKEERTTTGVDRLSQAQQDARESTIEAGRIDKAPSEVPKAIETFRRTSLRAMTGLLDALLGLAIEEQRKARQDRRGDDFPAEVSALIWGYEESERYPRRGEDLDQVYLLASDSWEGYLCALVVAEFLRAANNDRFGGRLVVHEPILVDSLQADDAGKFSEQGLAGLSKTIDRIVGDHQGADMRIHVTGGFKATLPPLVALASCAAPAEGGTVTIDYLFEKAKDLVQIPRLPVAFDLLSVRDYRGLVRALPEIEGGSNIARTLPEAIQGLFTHKADGRVEHSTLHRIIWPRYEAADAALTRFGRGYALTDCLASEELRLWFRAHVDEWQHAWLGDQIPEMVEHQRGHTQRILEVTSQVVRAALEARMDFPNEWEIACLLGAVWLHDTGHAVARFPYPDAATGDERWLDVHGFPTLVREFHHFLTAWQLEEDARKIERGLEGGVYFTTCKETLRGAPALIRAIATVALYHRQRMPIDGDQDFFCPESEAGPGGAHTHGPLGLHLGACPEVSHPVADGKTVRLRLVAALFRLLDASDFHEERVGTESYMRMQKVVSRRDVRALVQRLDGLWKAVASPSEHSQRPLEACGVDLAVANDCHGRIAESARQFASEGKEPDSETGKELDQKLSKLVHAFKGRPASHGDPAYLAVERWLTALSAALFKHVQDEHRNEKRGVRAVVYAGQRRDGALHFQAHVFHRRGKSDEEMKEFKANAEKGLLDLAKEYDKVRKVLNQYGLHFDVGPDGAIHEE